MANVELHFFAANDLNGSPILQVTDEDTFFEGLTINPTLDALGENTFTFSRQVGFSIFDAGAFQPETFVRVLIPAISATKYVWGFFLDARNQKLVSRKEAAGEDFVFGGPGPAFYLTRAILWDEQFSVDAARPYRIDLINGVFRFEGDADAGNVLSRLFREDDNNTIAQFLPDITKTFDHATDSAGNAWTDALGTTAEPFELPIGQSFLADVYAVQDAVPNLDITWDLGTTSARKFEMSAWQSYGRDLTGSSFGSGKVIFKEAVNIENDLDINGAAYRKASHVLVIGREGSYGRAVRTSWDPGEYAKAVSIDKSEVKWVPALERTGLRYLRRQDAGQEPINLEIAPGFSVGSGLYFPGAATTSGHFWIGDTVTVKTGTDASYTPLDYHYEAKRVTSLKMTLYTAADDTNSTTQALSWRVYPTLEQQRGSLPSPPNREATGVTGICCGPDHPDTGTPGTPPTAPTELIRWSFTDRGGSGAANLLDDNTDSFYWFSPNWEDGIGTSAWHADYDAHMSWGASGTVTQAVTPTTSGIPVTAGTLYTFSLDMSQRQADSNAWMRVEWYTAGGTQLQIDYIAGPGVSVAGKSTYTKVVTAPASATFIRLRGDAATGEFAAADNIVISYGGSSGTAATPGTSPVTTVGGTGSGQYSDSTEYIPVGSIIEHTYITDDGLYHRAVGVSIDDAGNYYVGTTVEAALQELGAGLNLQVNVVDPSGSTLDLDVSPVSVHEVHLNANCSITFSGMVSNAANRWWVHVFGDGSHVATFPDVLWPEDTAPTFDPTADSHWLEFICTDGVTVYGDYGGAAPTSITEIADLPTAETDTSLVLHPDGTGGIAWGTDATSGGGGASNLASGKVTRSAGDFSLTGSTAFTDVTGASITFTTAAHKVMLTFTGSWYVNNTAGTAALDFTVDGTRVGGTTAGLTTYNQHSTANEAVPCTMVFLTDALSAGSHTFKVQAKVFNAAHTLVVQGADPVYSFAAVEMYA